MATWLEKQRDKAKREKLSRELTHQQSYGQTDPRAQAMLDYARVTQDPNYVEPGLQGGVPTENVTGFGLSPLDLIGTGFGTKVASLGGSMLGALGATAIASKASKGAKLSDLARVMRSQRGVLSTPEQRLLQSIDVRKDGGTAMSVPEPLFDTIGLPNRGRELIQSKAEEYAQRLRDAGVNVVDVHHSGSAAGPSSYIKVQGYPDIRISGHSKGVFGSTGVVNVGNDAALEDVLAKIPKTVRKASDEEVAQVLAKQKEEEMATMYPIRIKSAQKKLTKGKGLTNSEQEAMDWLKNQREYQ